MTDDKPWKVKMEFGTCVMDDRFLRPHPEPPDPEHPAHLGNFCWCRGSPNAPHNYSKGICVAVMDCLEGPVRASDDARPRTLLQGLLQAYDDLSKRHGRLIVDHLELEQKVQLERKGLCEESWCCEMAGANVQANCRLPAGHPGKHESSIPGQPNSLVIWPTAPPTREQLEGTCLGYRCTTCRDTGEVVRPAQVVAQSKLEAAMPCPDCFPVCPVCSNRADRKHPCRKCGRGF